MKDLETVIKAISIDLDMSTSCDNCPYRYESNCNEKLLADLLQQIQWLEHENKVLRRNVIDLTKESEQLKRDNKKLMIELFDSQQYK